MKFRGMTNSSPRNHQRFYSNPLNAALTACALVIALAMVAPEPAFAQTFSVIYKFAGGPLGANPWAGMVMGRDGNLYGTTFNGGAGTCPSLTDGPSGCGTVFRFNPSTGRYTVLYQFTGGSDGGYPFAPLLIAPDGTLYGSTAVGGEAGCEGQLPSPGCGVIFHLQPRTTPPRNVLENYWVETPIYSFSDSDGNGPVGDLAMDLSGDIYGSTANGGSAEAGVVFKLTPSNGAWSESILHNFTGGNGGAAPNGVTLGSAGNIYGTTAAGGGEGCFNGAGCGTVYQLLAGSGWAENLLYSFTGGSDGGNPGSGVAFDSSGNLYSSTSVGGSKDSGTVFELSSGGWTFQLLYTFTDNGGGGPELSDLVFDRAGNLYGTTFQDGVSGAGSVFKLTPSTGGYIYTALHNFCVGDAACTDGASPSGTLVMDSSGNLYGTTQVGGSNSGLCYTDGSIGACGVIFKITP